MRPPPASPFVRAVNRAFADALVVEVRRCGLGRRELANKCGITRAYLQLLLAAQANPTIGSLILIAEGLGIRPDYLLRKALENLSRIRASALPPADPPP